MKTILEIENLSKIFKPKKRKSVKALEDVNFSVGENEFVSILGPSGCGKTTLINLIAGLDNPSSGKIRFKKNNLRVGVVFQKYTSFPWLTVLENVEFGLKVMGYSKKEREETARQYIKTVGLNGFEKEYPKNLSGGMEQRVALARTLATDPDILLMDEPFGSLDSQTRRLMQDLLVLIWEKTQKTVLFITHDVDEALFLSDRILIMSSRPGNIKKNIKIDLPRPRTIEVEFSEEYQEKREYIQRIISKESLKMLNEPISKIIKKIY